MNRKMLCQALLCLALTACNKVQTADGPAQDLFQHLRIDTVQTIPFSMTYITVGTVRAEAGKIAEVGLPMDGRIGSSFARLGARVNKGQPLFSVSSPEFADECKAYFQAESNYHLLQKAYARMQTLSESGIVSQREMEEKANELDLARRELTQWEHTMTALGLNMNNLKESGEMNIVAPISGEVVKMELTPGQYVRQDSPSLITIADLNSVWVSAQLKEYYLDCIHENDSVEVVLNTNQKYHTTGRVVYIGQLLDAETRSVEVLVACDNCNRELRPGMFAHVHFTAPASNAIQVPSTAIMQGENSPYVYVLNADSTFTRRMVEVETGSNGMVHIVNGLDVGERIVSEGGIFIK